MKAILLCLTLLALHTHAQAQLDFWSTPNQNVNIADGRVLGATATSTETVTLGSVITSRTLTQTVFNTHNTPSGFGADIYNGTFNVANPVQGASSVSLVWGGSGDMNLDLTTYGNAFQFTLLTNDIGSFLSMSVWNGSTEYSTGPVSIPSYNGVPPTVDFHLAFADFGAADFTNVDRISFEITSAQAADMTFANMQVVPVPEPSSALLIGLVGVIALTKRRRRA